MSRDHEIQEHTLLPQSLARQRCVIEDLWSDVLIEKALLLLTAVLEHLQAFAGEA